MIRLGSALLGLLITLTAFGQDVPDQVSIRDINDITDEALATLKAGGADMTQEQVNAAIKSKLNGENVRIVGVVLADPLNSGRASVNNDRVGRIHIFIRDTAAASEGLDGMTIQVVDGAYEDNGTLDLLVGDVVDVIGQVTYFANVVQITPTSIQYVDSYENLGLDASILDPVSVTTADLNVILDEEGLQQANWDNYESLINQYVEIDGAIVQRRTVDDAGRPWLMVASEGESWLLTIDTSLRYRNDRIGSYPSNFNVLESPYVPPPPGARVRLRGFVTFDNFDPLFLSKPTDAMLKITPWSDSDLEILESPPVVTGLATDGALPGADPVVVTVDVVADPERTIATVELNFVASDNPGETQVVAMTIAEAAKTAAAYSGQIPAQAQGVFVEFWVKATDSQDASTETAKRVIRFYPEGVNRIADIQETATGGPGPSPLKDLVVNMDITATVQSDPATSNWVIVQDDPELGGFSGIQLRTNESLSRGDVINITQARVQESFDWTRLSDVVFTVVSTGGDSLGYKTVTTDILGDAAVAEAHEGMMLRFENVLIVTNNADGAAGNFGEFAFASVGTPTATLRSDDASPAVDGGSTLFAGGEIIAYLQGFLYYSFGNYKLVPESPADFGEITNVANEQVDSGIPSRYALGQNYPNPFNPSTSLSYSVRQAGDVRIEVFDLMGRKVSTLVDAPVSAGTYEVTFHAGDLASGVYIYTMTAGNEVLTRKMLLQK